MNSGRLPIHADSMARQLKMLRDDDPVSPRRFNRHVPKVLETICLKCLMKKPAQRYASARELAEDLDLFLHGRQVRAGPLRL